MKVFWDQKALMGTQTSIREEDIEKGIEEANQVKILAKTERFSRFRKEQKKVFPIFWVARKSQTI